MEKLRTLLNSRKVHLIALVLLVVGLPLSFYSIRKISFLSRAAADPVQFFVLPSTGALPPDTTFRVMVDAKTYQLGYVSFTANFDPTRIRLTGEPIVSSAFGTVIKSTNASSANSTGHIAFTLGIDPANVVTPSTGVSELLELPMTVQNSQQATTNLSFDSASLEAVDLTSTTLPVSGLSTAISLNSPNTPAPTTTPTNPPTPTPGPINQTPTPSPTSQPTVSPSTGVVITITNPTPDGYTVTNQANTAFAATAYDSSVGKTNGAGIKSVQFDIKDTNGRSIYSHLETDPLYCAFLDQSGVCQTMPTAVYSVLYDGTYVLSVQALTTSGATATSTRTFKVSRGQGTPSPLSNGLVGQYFNNKDLTGLVLTRVDPQVNFDWGYNAPISTMDTDTFSIRWTGKFLAPVSGQFQFYTQADDGVRLWVNNVQLINDWKDHSTTEKSGTINLVAGQRYDIKLEYYENKGRANVKFLVSYPGFAKGLIPQTNLFPL